MSLLEHWGWSPFFEQQVGQHDDGGGGRRMAWARVVEEQRGLYRIEGDARGRAEVSGRFRHDAASAADFPAVGDWVGVTPSEGASIIHVRLERRSTISRAAPGRAVDRTGHRGQRRHHLPRDRAHAGSQPAPPRTIPDDGVGCGRHAGGRPQQGGPERRSRTGNRGGPPAPAARRRGVGERALGDRPRRPVAVPAAGTHGGARSACLASASPRLVNRLLGGDILRVGEVRESDGRGRHTTTSRQLVELPGGALLIDTPGMRELQLWSDESSVEQAFDDIAALARGCRFDDCGHGSEPGCAVVQAVADGQLDEDRLANYQRLLSRSGLRSTQARQGGRRRVEAPVEARHQGGPGDVPGSRSAIMLRLGARGS